MFGSHTESREIIRLRQQAEDAASAFPALMARAERAAHSLLHGEHNRKRAGHGLQFWQFREYTPFDRPQDIDWRQSGKAERIFIRQKELQTPQTTLFWCADGPGMDFHSHGKIPTKKDSAHVLAMALALLMTRAGDQAGILGALRSGRSEHALERLGHALVEDKHGVLPDPAALRLPKNSTLVLIGDFLSPLREIEHCFDDLAERAAIGIVIQVLDPAELDLPGGGRVIFEDPAKAHRQQVENAGALRDAYKQRIEDHIESVRHACRAHGWHYALHPTNLPEQDTLGALWSIFAERVQP